MPLQSLWQYLLRSLRELGWGGRYPLLVGVWESPLVASPSVQLWIPHRTIGAPVVEGIFEQIVEEGQFVGASPSTLPAALRQRIAEEAVYIACLFQELGYFGRCSLDAVLLDSGALLWIECNGRWGGVSIPMTLINRLIGEWQSRSFVIVHRFGLRLRARSFAEVVAELRDRLFRSGGPPKGIVSVDPRRHRGGIGPPFSGAGRYRKRSIGAGQGNRLSVEGRRSMCRLYGFRATEPTKIECTLVHAQNALIIQSYRDQSGTSHLNGWGLALYRDRQLRTIRRRGVAASVMTRIRQGRCWRPCPFPDRSGACTARDGRPSSL